ncbi:MAG: cysteine synthase [Myxococcales bacterium]|jgi:cysteine synthase B|nr:MAG: cysteine synthase [Myxococcales bacterium]
MSETKTAQRIPQILELIGRTPMLEIRRLRGDTPEHVRLFAKLEGYNPGGSVKDRPAWNMIRRGLDTGELRPGKTIIDSTSGNTGIALAMIGAALGYPVELVMPENVSAERKSVIRAYGAKPIYSSGLEGSDGALLLCRELHEANPERYFKPNQYYNEANPEAHYLTTGPEIWNQTDGRITHLVATLGTGGTAMGTGRYLKDQNREVQVIGVEPDDAFHGIEGLKHMESSIVPGIYHEEELDVKLGVSTEAAYDIVHRLAAEEGLMVGQSSGAALVAGLRVAQRLEQGCIVMIFCDFGDRYLTTNLWSGFGDA